MPILLERFWNPLWPNMSSNALFVKSITNKVVKYNKTPFWGLSRPQWSSCLWYWLVNFIHHLPKEIDMLWQWFACIPDLYFAYHLRLKMQKMLFEPTLTKFIVSLEHQKKVLTDNGTEFKNKLINEVCKQLGVKHKIYSPPYRPQS